MRRETTPRSPVVPGVPGGEIRPLTGIRGIAACLVMIYHMSGAGLGGSIVRHGYMAVDLFFVLSGFVMALTAGDWMLNRPLHEASVEFLIRRLARIYPLYIVMTVIVGLLAYATGGATHSVTLGLVIANLLMVQNWLVGPSLNEVAWSISTEFAAYLLFPLLVIALFNGGARTRVMVALLCLLCMGLLCALPDTASGLWSGDAPIRRHGPLDLYDGATPWPLLRCVAEFTLGIIVWLEQAWLVEKLGRWCTIAAVATLLLLAVPGSDFVLVPLFAVVIALLARNHGSAARTLSTRLAHALGAWSYAIYLVHPAVMPAIVPVMHGLAVLRWPHPWLSAVLAAALATIGIAWQVHERVEKPGRKLLRDRAATLPIMGLREAPPP